MLRRVLAPKLLLGILPQLLLHTLLVGLDGLLLPRMRERPPSHALWALLVEKADPTSRVMSAPFDFVQRLNPTPISPLA